ncbi:anhydro-N-acetylmuramic acid kinase [Nocardioidaceae bacterium SCSIO 66511]|nr:anhydro-N-acetylmuramic acid kinase [Nocardioidaceae bacterium SCSIO 66511]
MIVVAVASGTSADGCDVAAVEVAWDDTAIEMRVLGTDEYAFPDGLSARVLATLPPATPGMAEVCRLDTDLGKAFAAAAELGVRELAGGSADLVVSPGQTVFHDVVDDRCLGTLQLGQPAWIAERTGLAVVSDLRASDVAAGGHGAPLASTFDALWLAGLADGRPVAALNLGGIANASVVDPSARLLASFDTGPANCLLDVAAAQVSGGAFASDVDGRLALAGSVDERLLERLLADTYFDLAPPKSTGRELFSADFLASARAGLEVSDADLLATLTEFTARTIGDALRPYGVGEVVASGGGVRNPALMQAIERQLAPATLARAEDHGVDGDAKEVLLWALLGFLSWHGLPGTVHAGERVSTGAAEPRVLGRITRGAEALDLPTPRTSAPSALRLTLG